jgi:hypothetical protein
MRVVSSSAFWTLDGGSLDDEQQSSNPRMSGTVSEDLSFERLDESDIRGGTVLVTATLGDVGEQAQYIEGGSTAISPNPGEQWIFCLSDIVTVESEYSSEVRVDPEMESTTSSLSMTPSILERAFQNVGEDPTVKEQAGDADGFQTTKEEETHCAKEERQVAKVEKESVLAKVGQIFVVLVTVGAAFLLGLNAGQRQNSAVGAKAKRNED